MTEVIYENGTLCSSNIADAKFLVANFGFTEEFAEELLDVITQLGGYIAGGAPLYWFLGLQSPAEQDLDIWIPVERDSYEAHGAHSERYDMLLDVLSKAGYTDISLMENMALRRYKTEEGVPCTIKRGHILDKSIDIPYHTQPELANVIRAIRDYRNVSGRRVQIIYYNSDTDPVDNFDLNICKICVRRSYDGTYRFCFPDGLTEEDLQKRTMKIVNDSSPFLINRINKYIARGFHLQEEPFPHDSQ